MRRVELNKLTKGEKFCWENKTLRQKNIDEICVVCEFTTVEHVFMCRIQAGEHNTIRYGVPF